MSDKSNLEKQFEGSRKKLNEGLKLPTQPKAAPKTISTPKPSVEKKK